MNDNQKISNFFKPLTYSKSATQRVVQSKVLTDSTNTPQKKKKSKSVNIPVKPLVFEIEPLVRRLSPETHNNYLLSVTC